MNLKYSLLLCLWLSLSAMQLKADITTKPSPLPPSAQKLTFKQKWKRFFQNVSDDFHMEDRTSRMADKFHEELRKPSDVPSQKKLSKKERKALEKARKKALKDTQMQSESTYRPYSGEVVAPDPYQPVQPVQPVQPTRPEPLALDPVR